MVPLHIEHFRSQASGQKNGRPYGRFWEQVYIIVQLVSLGDFPFR